MCPWKFVVMTSVLTKGNLMDLQKLLSKLPAILKKVKDAENLDGKFTLADILFFVDLAKLAFEKAVQDPQPGYFIVQGERGSQATEGADMAPTLDPANHDQMVAYLKTLPTMVQQTDHEAVKVREGDASVTPTTFTQTEAGPSIQPSSEPRQVVEWLPVALFALDLVGKLIAKWKNKK
jgi:hypothetical protein